MAACTQQSSQWDAYSQCLLDCTCGVSNLNYMDYCHDRFVMNVTRHDLCLCLTTRCMVRCFQEAGCGELSGCLALEQQMPCNLNCVRPEGGSEPLKRWAWASNEWPCISSLEPAEATTILEPQDSGTTLYVSLGIACFVAVIIMFICFCTCRYLRTGKSAMEAEMEGRV
mmetsp:Transcript_14967/g.18032  ORF Transcript_14967/g.18032 Transcript_14967/m.18032 type:complete len:169 (-) Transcript_14967:109-615(-)|eukprot:Skav202522  [mRNA]  locus=scaffold2011:23483:25787:- [translate_table: standard]